MIGQMLAPKNDAIMSDLQGTDVFGSASFVQPPSQPRYAAWNNYPEWPESPKAADLTEHCKTLISMADQKYQVHLRLAPLSRVGYGSLEMGSTENDVCATPL